MAPIMIRPFGGVSDPQYRQRSGVRVLLAVHALRRSESAPIRTKPTWQLALDCADVSET